MNIPFIDLKTQYSSLQSQIHARINTVLEHGQYILGPETQELEERLAAYTGAKHCITVASGTEALLISLMALNIKPGDEIITTPFTFVATAEVIVLLGAKPVFVDIETKTYNIDASLIEAQITKKTKAIMPVSLYGQPADMDEINAIATRHGNIPVIEDAAQSFGATYKGRRSCNLSTIGCTSFFPSKPLGCYGDGGAIFTDDDALAIACKETRAHGQSQRYVHTRIGVGGRMDTLQAAIVLAKLDRFSWEVEQRQKIGNEYSAMIAIQCPNVITPYIEPHNTSVYAQYSILVENRSAIIQHLKQWGIPTAVHYPTPLNRQPAYQNRFGGDATPISDQVAQKIMSLPMGPDLSREDQLNIVSSLLRACHGKELATSASSQ